MLNPKKKATFWLKNQATDWSKAGIESEPNVQDVDPEVFDFGTYPDKNKSAV